MKRIAIIGSGLGGLTAGNLLARQGHEVTIFESHTSAGGYTAGFKRKGFYFESGTLSFESSDMVFPLMKEIGVYDRIEFVRQKLHLLARPLEGVCASFADFKRLALAAFPQEKPNLERYFAVNDRMIKAVTALATGRGLSAALTFPWRLARVMALYLKYSKLTSDQFTARYFASDTLLYRFLKDLGYPQMSAAVVPMAYASFFDDYWTVKSGMQSWADALAENFRSLGGDLRLNTRVDKIVTRHKTAIGIEAAGRFHPADWVISAADYKKTFLQMLDNPGLVPAKLQKKIGETAVSEGIVTVYLGLNMTPAELSRYLKAPHASYRDDLDADVRAVNDRDYFRKVAIGLYAPCLHEPSLAPAGKTGLMIQAVSPYRWLNNWGGGDRQTYAALKEEVKLALIGRAEAMIPGLSGRIEFSEAATPLTYERYTANTDGATSAWSWNPKNKFYRNIISISIDTPIKRLLIGSCWSNQIGGVPSALMAAKRCAKKIGSL